MNNYKLDLLSRKQLWGKEKLEVLKKYGLETKATDLAIYTGCLYNFDDKNHICKYYTSSIDSHEYGNISLAQDERPVMWDKSYVDYYAIRPILTYSNKDQRQILSNKETESDVCKITLGEYPTTLSDISNKLEKLFNKDKLVKTGKKYTLKLKKIGNKYEPITYDEYEYEGKKYIRIEDNSVYYENEEKKVNEGKYVFLEVTKIKWLVDEKTKTLIAENGLLSGIPFNNKEIYDGDFNNTIMSNFLNEYMVKDLFKKDEFIKEKLPEDISLSLIKDNEYHNMIDELIVKILKLLNNMDNPDISETVKNKIKTLLENFNNELDQHNNFNIFYKEALYQKLGYNLNNILHKLELSNIGLEEYFNMNNLLTRYIELLNNNELYQELGISDNILKLDELGKKELYDETLSLLTNYQNKLESYINNIKSLNEERIIDLSCNNVCSLRHKITDEINVSVYNIKNKVLTRNFVIQFNKGIEQIRTNKYEENSNIIAGIYLEYINNIYQSIINNDPDKLPEFLELLNFNIEENDFDTLNESLKKIIIFNNDLRDRNVLVRTNKKEEK